jgi:5-amino-6-(5-phospho-D-ribitylamino)uracil phosphatase
MATNKYLASVDLDATLLKDDKTISAFSKNYIKKFVEDGNYFIINTGRPFQSAIEFLQMLEINQPVIVNNGGAIVYFDEEYSKVVNYEIFTMDKLLVKNFNKEVKPYLSTALITSLFNIYSYDFSLCPFWVLHESNMVKFIEGDVSSLLNDDPIRSEYYVKEEYINEFLSVLDKYKDNFNIIDWGNHEGNIHSFEVTSKKGNKGDTMLYLASKLGIPKENTLAFGDQLNDLEMIVKAGDGVAMANARDEVKAKAKNVTRYTNDEDGVINYLIEALKNRI